MTRYLSDSDGPTPGTRRQGELPEQAEFSSSDVVFWEAQLDPDTNRNSEAQEAVGRKLSRDCHCVTEAEESHRTKFRMILSIS
jgi:hypothetical protein